eukprot:scaffold4724_cov19-Tisochrysis_lutea.AAC.1
MPVMPKLMERCEDLVLGTEEQGHRVCGSRGWWWRWCALEEGTHDLLSNACPVALETAANMGSSSGTLLLAVDLSCTGREADTAVHVQEPGVT